MMVSLTMTTMTTMHLFLSSSTSITSPGNPSICRHGTSAGVHPTHAICCYQINIHSYTILHSYIYIDARRATPRFHSPIQSPWLPLWKLSRVREPSVVRIRNGIALVQSFNWKWFISRFNINPAEKEEFCFLIDPIYVAWSWLVEMKWVYNCSDEFCLESSNVNRTDSSQSTLTPDICHFRHINIPKRYTIRKHWTEGPVRVTLPPTQVMSIS